MPSNSPYGAVGAFLEPLERVVACLGSGKLAVSPSGRHAPNETHSWILNEGRGLRLSKTDGDQLGTFKASMRYEIVPTDPTRHEGKWRVSTRAYAYELLAPEGHSAWSMHWHPIGSSGITVPHYHLPAYGDRHHLNSPRHTLESAVQWCIEMGAAATGDAVQVLAETEGVHKLWRSWTD